MLMSFTVRSAVRLLGVVALGIALAACASARRKAQGDIVRDVHFAGNGGALSGQSSYVLRGQIATRGSGFGVTTWGLDAFVRGADFKPDLLDSDSYRLEVWYAHHGWFDAAVNAWAIEEISPRTKHKAGVFDVVGVVVPGERSLVRHVDVVGLTPVTESIGRNLVRTSTIQPELPFVYDDANYAKGDLTTRLEEAGFAYAKVDLQIDAFPTAHAVDITLSADQGIPAVFGDIVVHGNEVVPEAVIRDELRIVTGDPYRVSTLRDAQRHLFDMGVFSVVTVEPDLTHPDLARIPIDVTLSEAKFRTLRLGGGFDYDSTLRPTVMATYRHTNLFHQLVKFEVRLQFGWQFGFSAATDALITHDSLSIQQPRLLGSRKFGARITTSYTQDLLNQQLPYQNPQVDASLTWRPVHDVLVAAGPHWEEKRFFGLEANPQAALAAKVAYGEGFKNPYRLTTFDINATIDERDDPIDARRGTYTVLGARQSVPFGPDDFFYSQLSADARGYAPFPALPKWLRRPDERATGLGQRIGRTPAGLVRLMLPENLAIRGYATAMQPWGGRPTPFPERKFLGGAQNLRGFWSDAVGPYSCACLETPTGGGDAFTMEPHAGKDVKAYYLPEGGQFAALTSVEARYDTPWGFRGAVFFDAGFLGNQVAKLSPAKDLRVGYGFGARYKSPIGILRGDLAFRPLYPEDWGPTQYINCDLEHRIPRSFDVFSLPKGNRDLGNRWIPFAVGFYIGFGEAI
jgi:outer membrane protein assembly factor BamA